MGKEKLPEVLEDDVRKNIIVVSKQLANFTIQHLEELINGNADHARKALRGTLAKDVPALNVALERHGLSVRI